MFETPSIGKLALGLAVAVLIGTPALADELTGQVVCSACWFEAARPDVPYGNEADLACARDCAEGGVPPALAVRDGDEFVLYELYGKPPEGGEWLAWIGRFVVAQGESSARGDVKTFTPASMSSLAQSPWPRVEPAEGEVRMEWRDLRGRALSVSDFRNRILLVNFWATWCKPCIDEMPDLVEIHDEFAPYGVEVLGVAADAFDQRDAVLRFVEKHEINFPIALGATTEQMKSVGLDPVLPGTVLLDEHGHVLESYSGVIDPKKVAARVRELLGHKSAESKPGVSPEPQAPSKRVARARTSNQASLVPS